MGITVTAHRSDGYQGMTLAQIGVATERAMEETIKAGLDPAGIEPKVRVTATGKIKSISVSIP